MKVGLYLDYEPGVGITKDNGIEFSKFPSAILVRIFDLLYFIIEKALVWVGSKEAEGRGSHIPGGGIHGGVIHIRVALMHGDWLGRQFLIQAKVQEKVGDMSRTEVS